MTSDWTELPNFPRTFASTSAPWRTVARIVNGARVLKHGKEELLSGTRAFLQSLEGELIAARSKHPDVATLVGEVLDAHARNIDEVLWCRVRGDDLHMGLRVYAARGTQQLHLSLAGPVGRHADRPLPERAATTQPRKRAKPARPAPLPVVTPPTGPRLAPPATPLVLRPLLAGAGPSYGDPIALDRDGRLHVSLRPGNDYAYACVEPSGSVTLTPMLTREQLRETDVGAMTGALMPELHATAAGLLRIDHYENTSGMQERIELAGRWHASRRGLFSDCWVLGVHDEWFLRCIINNNKATLVGVHLGGGKRVRVDLPAGLALRGAAIDRGPDGLLLRALDGPNDERRFRLQTAPKLAIEPVASVTHGLPLFVQPVPNTGGWVVAAAQGGRCELRLVTGDGAHTLFRLPPGFTAAGYAPWGLPRVTQVGFGDAASWQVALDFGADGAPRCTGALVFTAAGAVLGCAYVDAESSLRIGGIGVSLAESEHVCGIAGGPAGDLAAVLRMREGLSVVWSPPGV
jgi:hypothetical protein